MRKILELSFIFILFLCMPESAQSFRRTDKIPNFFVPTGVLRTQPAPEKLPDIKQMQYQGQKAPIVTQMEQERLAKQAAEKQKKVEEQEAKAKKERYERIKAEKAKITKQRLDKKATVTASTKETAAEENTESVISSPLNNIPTFDIDESTDIHTRILQEYIVDLQHISRGESVKNTRLQNMLSDWTDKFYPAD